MYTHSNTYNVVREVPSSNNTPTLISFIPHGLPLSSTMVLVPKPQ